MKKNVGKTDKIVRITAAIIIALLSYTGLVTGTMSIVLLVLAAVLLLTSFISFCPLYAIIGMNTCSASK